MKTSHVVSTALIGLLTAGALWAEESRTFTIPLTRPGEPITMEIDLIAGEIHVTGEDRDDVLLEIVADGAGRKIITPSGPKNIPGGALQLEIEEHDNQIEIDSDWRTTSVVLRARVPRHAQLSLSTVHDGVIQVDGITGNLELENVHGDITARGIRGTVIAESVHGQIVVELLEVPPEHPMAFETLHGDIELHLPSDFGAQLHILSAAEEVYTDFEVEILPYEPMVDRSERGRFVIDMNREIVAAINGGGSPLRIETRYGDVRVLKSRAH